MATAATFLKPIATWTRDALVHAVRRSLEEAARLGRATEGRVLAAAKAMEIPAVRVEALAALPLESRDAIAERLARGASQLAVVAGGAAGALPVASLPIELIALAELNVVQVDHIARAYGYRIGNLPPEVSRALPLGGSTGLLFLPILAALEVRALERDGKMESVADLISGAAGRAEAQALAGRLAAAASLAMLKRLAGEALAGLIPLAGSAVSAWWAYTFTDAVGREARRYFRDLALGEQVVPSRLAPAPSAD